MKLRYVLYGIAGIIVLYLWFLITRTPTGSYERQIQFTDRDFVCQGINEKGIVNAISSSTSELMILRGTERRVVSVGTKSIPITEQGDGFMSSVTVCKYGGDATWIETGGREATPETGVLMP